MGEERRDCGSRSTRIETDGLGIDGEIVSFFRHHPNTQAISNLERKSYHIISIPFFFFFFFFGLHAIYTAQRIFVQYQFPVFCPSIPPSPLLLLFRARKNFCAALCDIEEDIATSEPSLYIFFSSFRLLLPPPTLIILLQQHFYLFSNKS